VAREAQDRRERRDADRLDFHLVSPGYPVRRAPVVLTGCLEKVRQWCSRVIQILNVPQRVRRQFSLASALPDGLFEHPDALLTSTPIWTVPPAYGVETEFFRSLLEVRTSSMSTVPQ
jgi:hypothetical protein